MKSVLLYLWFLAFLRLSVSDSASKEHSADDTTARKSHPPPPQEPFPDRPFISDSFSAEMSYEARFPNSEHIRTALSLHPPILRYSNTLVCIPKIATIDITNNDEEDIMLYNIASNDSQFHPVLFRPQAVPPKHTLSVQILFLPYFTHAVEALLHINTSIGDVSHHIVGDIAENPYRLHPLIGYRIPSGVPFEQPFTIHNPHPEVLRIREIFTTEEFLSLHEISDDAIAGKTLPPAAGTTWELDPGSERAVIRISMGSNMPGNYNGYVHLRTDKDTIVVPVELTVLDGGLHALPAAVDFGHLTAVNQMSSVTLEVMNSGSHVVAIMDIVPTTADAHFNVAKSSTQVLFPGKPTAAATLTFQAPATPGSFSGKLLIFTNHSNPALATLEVPYTASVLYGGIGFEFQDGLFKIPVLNHSSSVSDCSTTPITRAITFTNYFDVPLQVISADISSCSRVLTIAGIPEERVMPSHVSWSPLLLQFNHSLACSAFQLQRQLPFSCWIEFLTNVSTLQVPLHVLDGSVMLETPFEKRIEVVPSGLRGSGYGSVDALLNAASAVTALPTLLSSDALVLNLGQVAAVSPRPIKLFLSNPNPIRTHVTISSRHWPMRICFESPRPMATRKQYSFTRNNLSGSFAQCDEVNSTHPIALGMEVKAEHQMAIVLYPRALASTGQQARMIEVLSTYHRKVVLMEMVSVSGAALSAYNPKSAFSTVGIPSSIAIHTKSTFTFTTDVQNIMLTSNAYGASVVTTSIPANGSVLTAEIFPLVQPCITKEEHIYACWMDMLTSTPSFTDEAKKTFSQTLVTISALMTLSRNFSLAHDKIVSLRSAWIREQKFGIPVVPFDVALTCHSTTSSVRVEPRIMMPLSTTPQHVLMEIPTIPTDHIAVLTVTIGNPFQVLIEFMPAFANIDIVYLENDPLSHYSLVSADAPVIAKPVFLSNSSVSNWCDASIDPACSYVGVDNQFAVIKSGTFSEYKLLPEASLSLKPGFYFMTHQTHITLPPRTHANISQIIYVPPSNASSAVDELSLYIANNFTGVDRFDIRASAAKVELTVVAVQAHFHLEQDPRTVTSAVLLPTGAYLIPVIDRSYTLNVTIQNTGLMPLSVEAMRIHAADIMPMCKIVPHLECGKSLEMRPLSYLTVPFAVNPNCLVTSREFPVQLLSKGEVVFVLNTVHSLTQDMIYSCLYERERTPCSPALQYAVIAIILACVLYCAVEMTKIWNVWETYVSVGAKLSILCKYQQETIMDGDMPTKYDSVGHVSTSKDVSARSGGGINLSDVIVSDTGVDKLHLKAVDELRSKRISTYYSKPLTTALNTTQSVISTSNRSSDTHAGEVSIPEKSAAAPPVMPRPPAIATSATTSITTSTNGATKKSSKKSPKHDSPIVVIRGTTPTSAKQKPTTPAATTEFILTNSTTTSTGAKKSSKTKSAAAGDEAIDTSAKTSNKTVKAPKESATPVMIEHTRDKKTPFSNGHGQDSNTAAFSVDTFVGSASVASPRIGRSQNSEFERVDDDLMMPQHTRTRSISLNAGIEASINSIINSSSVSDMEGAGVGFVMSEPMDALPNIAHSRSADSHEVRGYRPRGVSFPGPGDTISLQSMSGDSNEFPTFAGAVGDRPSSLFSTDPLMDDLMWASQQRAPPGFSSHHQSEASTFSDTSLFSTNSFFPKTPREVQPPPGYEPAPWGTHFDPFSETFDGFGLGEASTGGSRYVGSIGERPQRQPPHYRQFSSFDSHIPVKNTGLATAPSDEGFFGSSAFFNISWSDDTSLLTPLEGDSESSKME